MVYFKISKVFLFISVLSIAVVTTSTLFPFIVGKYIWFRVSVDLALIFFVLGLLFQKTQMNTNKNTDEHRSGNIRVNQFSHPWLSVFRQPIVIVVSFFVLAFLLACLFGVNPSWSFWSNFERGEGGLQILHLYAFFILLIMLFKEEKDWRRLFWFSVIAGLLVTFYGAAAGLKYVDAEMVVRSLPGGGQEWVLSGNGGPLFQTFKWAVGPSFSVPGYRFQGSIGNPAYVAAYAVFMMFYAGYLLMSKYKNRLLSVGSLGLWFLLALFVAVFFAAATRGTFLGFIAALLVFLGYLVFSSSRWRKWFISLGAIIIILVVLLIQFKDTAFVKSLPVSRIFDISFSTKTFEDRAIMWKIAIDGWLARPIFGWGPENFLRTFDEHFNIKYFKPAEGFGAWFDRAHSVYFDYLAETGALGLLSFLGMWVIFYWGFFKKKMTLISVDKHQSVVTNALIFALPVAYLVQGIVLFDVLPIYINIFLFLAFASYKLSNQQPKNEK